MECLCRGGRTDLSEKTLGCTTYVCRIVLNRITFMAVLVNKGNRSISVFENFSRDFGGNDDDENEILLLFGHPRLQVWRSKFSVGFHIA